MPLSQPGKYFAIDMNFLKELVKQCKPLEKKIRLLALIKQSLQEPDEPSNLFTRLKPWSQSINMNVKQVVAQVVVEKQQPSQGNTTNMPSQPKETVPCMFVSISPKRSSAKCQNPTHDRH
jgi:hypothetical protein